MRKTSDVSKQRDVLKALERLASRLLRRGKKLQGQLNRAKSYAKDHGFACAARNFEENWKHYVVDGKGVSRG